jgi:RNA polymerase sigma-70 factor (ECF subfamily)
VPERSDLRERLDAVLEAIHAAFAVGSSDPSDADAGGRDLAEEGIWLGRLVASLLPDEPAPRGLLASMLRARNATAGTEVAFPSGNATSVPVPGGVNACGGGSL